METNPTETLRVLALARQADMSESGFRRLFRQVTGQCPTDHLIHCRIERAKRLLRRPELSVAEVAMRSGFNDSNYFARQFRRLNGMSARAWRLAATTSGG